MGEFVVSERQVSDPAIDGDDRGAEEDEQDRRMTECRLPLDAVPAENQRQPGHGEYRQRRDCRAQRRPEQDMGDIDADDQRRIAERKPDAYRAHAGL